MIDLRSLAQSAALIIGGLGCLAAAAIGAIVGGAR